MISSVDQYGDDDTIDTSMPPVSIERRIYGNAPIVEAIIDLRCANPPDVTFRDVVRVATAIAALGYAQAGETVRVVQRIDSDGSSERSETKVGVALRSSDEKYIVQVQIEGFSFSRLRPYSRWETFLQEAKRLWLVYEGALRPEFVSRLGIRYVNRFDLGVPAIDDLTPFLKLHPVTPWGLTSPPASFFLQIQQPRDAGTMLLVNETIVQNAGTGQVAVVLDLDAFVEREMPANDPDVWNLVEDLHVKVEDAFEASITDRTRELIT